MTRGTVRDIRTGRAIGKTDNLTEHFAKYVQRLIEQDLKFYLVHGRCQHQDVRDMVTFLHELDDIPVIYDPQMSSDRVYVFEGDPSELGFAV